MKGLRTHFLQALYYKFLVKKVKLDLRFHIYNDFVYKNLRVYGAFFQEKKDLDKICLKKKEENFIVDKDLIQILKFFYPEGSKILEYYNKIIKNEDLNQIVYITFGFIENTCLEIFIKSIQDIYILTKLLTEIKNYLDILKLEFFSSIEYGNVFFLTLSKNQFKKNKDIIIKFRNLIEKKNKSYELYISNKKIEEDKKIFYIFEVSKKEIENFINEIKIKVKDIKEISQEVNKFFEFLSELFSFKNNIILFFLNSEKYVFKYEIENRFYDNKTKNGYKYSISFTLYINIKRIELKYVKRKTLKQKGKFKGYRIEDIIMEKIKLKEIKL